MKFEVFQMLNSSYIVLLYRAIYLKIEKSYSGSNNGQIR